MDSYNTINNRNEGLFNKNTTNDDNSGLFNLNREKEPRTFSLNKNYSNNTSKETTNLESKQIRHDIQQQYKSELDSQVNIIF